jgi:hypothetical protein
MRGDDLAALARVLRRRQRQRHVQRRRDAGLAQQRLGLLGVVGVHAGQVDVAQVGGREVAADGLAQAFLRAVDEGLAVDGVRDGAAHAHVVQRLLAVVDRQDALARGAADLHREALVALELLSACSAPKRGMPSMSPASRAATCAAGSLMKRNTTRRSLMSAALRWPSHLLSVTELPLFQFSSLKGPVPTGLVAPWRAVGVQDDRGVLAQAERQRAVGVVQHQDHRVRSCTAMREMLSNTAFLALLVLPSAPWRARS